MKPNHYRRIDKKQCTNCQYFYPFTSYCLKHNFTMKNSEMHVCDSWKEREVILP